MRDAITTLEALSDAVVAVNREGKIELVNRATEILFGYNREELIGQSLGMLLPERVRGRHEEHLRGYFVEPRVRVMGRELILSAVRKDGTEFSVEINLAPVNNGLEAVALIKPVSDKEKWRFCVSSKT